MGCACKEKGERVMKAIPEFKPHSSTKKGIMAYLYNIGANIYYIIIRIIIAMLSIIFAIPFIIISLTMIIIFGKNFSIKLPKEWIKKLTNLEKKYG